VSVLIEARPCEGCGGSHIGPRCPAGTRWIDRLRSVQLDGKAMETRAKRNYFDQEAVDNVFGDGAEERMNDQTHGRGPLYRGRKGWYRVDRKERQPVAPTEPDFEFYTGGDTEQAGDTEPA
jgi:hypothetical protein